MQATLAILDAAISRCAAALVLAIIAAAGLVSLLGGLENMPRDMSLTVRPVSRIYRPRIGLLEQSQLVFWYDSESAPAEQLRNVMARRRRERHGALS